MDTKIPDSRQIAEIILYAVGIIQLCFGIIIVLGRIIIKQGAKNIETLFNFHNEQQRKCAKCGERIARLEAKIDT